MTDVPTFDDLTGESETTTSDTSTSSTPDVVEPVEGAVELILDALESKGKLVEFSAFAEDAPDVAEQYREYYGIPDDVETLSVEELFGLDLDGYDLVGTKPLTLEDNLSDEQLEMLTEDEHLKQNGDPKKYVVKPEYAEQLRGLKSNDGITQTVFRAINGRYGDLIDEKFGEGKAVKVGKGKSRLHDDDDVEAMKFLHFTVTDNDGDISRRFEAAVDADELEQEEADELVEDYTGDD